jgi:dTDP-4-amino-4,6-dideoxygalactose transaminase
VNKRIFLSPPCMTGDERKRVAEAFDSNYIAPCGPMVERFERDFAAKTGFGDACALASGTAAVDLLCEELGVGRGSRVVCSDLTFISSVGPAFHRGAKPVFIDCDEASWTMDCALLDKALSAGSARMVVATDLYGQCCDYERLEAVCAAHGTALVIDSAEALGATFGGRSAGQAGKAALFSFNGNKIITTSGGGMLVSHDPALVKRARFLSQQARQPVPWYEHDEVGYNYRMSNIVGAIGVGQLAHLDEFVAKKRRIFGWYKEMLGDLPRIRFMPEAGYGRCTRWLTVAEVAPLKSQRTTHGEKPRGQVTALLAALEAENIEARPVWKPMHCQPVFKGAEFFSGPRPVGTRLFENGICLPSGCALTKRQVERVCAVVRKQIG